MKSTRPIGIISLLQIGILVLIAGKALSQDLGHQHGNNVVRTPIEFVENKGQWSEPFLFRANLGGGDIYLRKNAIRMMFLHPDDMKQMTDARHGVKPDSGKGNPIYNPDGGKYGSKTIGGAAKLPGNPGGGEDMFPGK